ncbi:hypothetical protein E2C01_034391 [Portunus trituberculatus]|uniref:Uncharacterized protein n=1 Tax=Portunus trituberculatus TaxID=210409 RepID=A0A5B7F2R3_PORTR|nr:hypothetical protein [Portunus trituberculatus]
MYWRRMYSYCDNSRTCAYHWEASALRQYQPQQQRLLSRKTAPKRKVVLSVRKRCHYVRCKVFSGLRDTKIV